MGELWARIVTIRSPGACDATQNAFLLLPISDGQLELFEFGLFAYFLSLTVWNSTALNFVDFGLWIIKSAGIAHKLTVLPCL